jgi:alkylated DNA repair dioxygenase AlkB
MRATVRDLTIELMRSAAQTSSPPEGFKYVEELVLPEVESELIREIERLPLKEFEFQGYTGQRRVVSYGWHYDFGSFSLNRADSVPGFLEALRTRAAAFAGLPPDGLAHVLVTEYTPGSPIGWHRDKPAFEDVIGISLGSACRFRFRRKNGESWERYSLILEPRSVYLLRGPARTDWEHSIPAVDDLRYSITFRSLRQPE